MKLPNIQDGKTPMAMRRDTMVLVDSLENQNSMIDLGSIARVTADISHKPST